MFAGVKNVPLSSQPISRASPDAPDRHKGGGAYQWRLKAAGSGLASL